MICRQCPRNCGAERGPGRKGGACGMPEEPVLARAALHFWEEPCISGETGVGALFFSGCSLGCVFCQNREISQEGFGRGVSRERLLELFRELEEQGATAIELVTPSHYTDYLAELLEEHKPPLPVIWNSSGYESVSSLKKLQGKVDVYLPDLKYADGELALRCSGAADYPEVARAAIREMLRQTGPCELENGLLKRGVLIRHLILPGALENTRRVLDWIAAEFPSETVLVSLMSQYTPRLGLPAPLDRRITAGEARAAEEYMRNLGLLGYAQDRSSAQREFTPDFDLTGL